VEEHAAHVTIICCGALCAIVVVCNETEWQEVYFCLCLFCNCSTWSCVMWSKIWCLPRWL